jgi:AcrR family transcriptional regulator
VSKQRDTRQQLILAAERLFAERGIEGVSLREINLAAKQRNTSAAHYHFGSKEALVEAIFEYRRTEIGRRRDELLDRLEAEGRSHDLRALAEVLVRPLAPELQQGEDPSRYLEFLAHLFLMTPEKVGEILRRHQAAEGRWAALLLKALPGVPRSLLGTRLFLMARHVVTSLAVYHRRGLETDDVSLETYLSDMIDAVAGYLGAPPSASTLALAKVRDERYAADQAAAGAAGQAGSGAPRGEGV